MELLYSADHISKNFKENARKLKFLPSNGTGKECDKLENEIGERERERERTREREKQKKNRE